MLLLEIEKKENKKQENFSETTRIVQFSLANLQSFLEMVVLLF